MKGIRFSLSQKAFISLFLMLLPVAVTFLAVYRNNTAHLERNAVEDLSVIAEAYEGQVYQFLEMSKRRARDFASDGFVREEIKRILSNKAASEAALNNHLIKNKLVLDKTILEINVMSLDGRIIASTDPGDIGRDVSNEPYFIKGSVKPSASEVLMHAHGEHDEIAFSSPVIDRGAGRVIGVVVNVISLKELNRIVSGEYSKEFGAITWARGRRKTMEVYLVNSQKLMLTESAFVKNAPLTQAVDTAPVKECLASRSEISKRYMNYRGVEVAGASNCLPELGWTLLVEVDAREIFAASSAMFSGALAGGAAVAGVIGLFFVLFLRTVVRPLRAMTDKAGYISSGNYDVKVPVATRDEVGALGNAFNAMSADIKEMTASLKESEARLKEAQRIGRIGSGVWDIATDRLEWSDEALRILCVRPEGFKGTMDGFLELIHSEDRQAFKEGLEAVMRKERESMSVEHRIIRPDARMAWIHSLGKIEFDDRGVPVRGLGVIHDITERKEREEEENLRKDALARHSAAMITLVTRASTIRESLEDSLKFITETIAGALEVERASVWLLSPGALEARCVDLFEKTLKRHSGGAVIGAETFPDFLSALEAFRVVDASYARTDPRTRGFMESYSVSAGITSALDSPIRIAGKLSGVVCAEHVGSARRWSPDEADFAAAVAAHLSQAFTEEERRKAEAELKKLSTVIENSVNIVVITDRDGVIEYINPMFETVTGYGRDEAVGKNARMLASGETQKADYAKMWQQILAGRTWHGIFKNKKKDGSFYWASTVVSPIKDDIGNITNFLSVQEDVTQRRAVEEKMEYLRAYDDATGLYNRAWFIKEMDNCLPFALNEKKGCALLFIDIDRFQYFNDTYGHTAGDETLNAVARLVKNTVGGITAGNGGRIESIIGRLGSDEFALLLVGVDVLKALSAADEIRKRVEFLHLAAGEAHITVSAGIAMFPEHGSTVGELFSKADAAISRAKEMGRNRCHLYSLEDRDLEDMHLRLADKERILHALEKDLFLPWYQPILDLKSNTVGHYEALARLRTETGEILAPAKFIDTAERFGLVESIDRVIIEKVMLRQASLARKGNRCAFSINLSGKEMGDKGILDFLVRTVSTTGADPGRLIFEITETAAIQEFDRAVRFINDLKKMGLRFSLDDFGVGFTSFHYLKEMKVDYIKIDGSFIKRLDENPHDQLFVKAIISVAKGMGIKTVAEFVEREAVLKLLKEYGVDYGQGYFIGKPAPAIEGSDA